MHFSHYAERVTLLVRGTSLARSLSQYLVARISEAPNVAVRYRTEVSAVDGDATLRVVTVTDRATGDRERIDAARLFVCIGGVPNTEWARKTPIIRDEAGYLVTGPDLLAAGASPACWPLERQPYYLETSVPGSFAAGDVRHGSMKRVAAAVGEGAMAVSFVHRYLEEFHG